MAEFSIADDDTIVFEVKDHINGWILCETAAPEGNN